MTAPIEAGGNDLRARWACDHYADLWNPSAVPAYDEHGRPTGRVAIDPADLDAWLADHREEAKEDD
ncbi:hypothetical protein EV644_11221 [Kribbella orskensis]|uniref:Uncharacterized protein n=1 Tax=Kribbella orskensis TaxID=2512216 RepID=A0ABY2BFM4_9ACTN|nr:MULTISPECIES: hypothetical protein [Kribbella]TCN36857.1 hypothetical protein EV642_11321 [Kribbella sp. VKM Ac-2500]TCO18281.1 hypothetical protein EV644_11221 [Kribbella orskensis]